MADVLANGKGLLQQNYCEESQEMSSYSTETQFKGSDENEKEADLEELPISSLAKLKDFLNAKIPDQLTSMDLNNAAHELIDKLNTKRKVDTILLEQYKQALESQITKMVEQMEQHMYDMHEAMNNEVEKKLQDLFSCVNKIATAEEEIENFRESLRVFYQEMHNNVL